MKGFKIGGGSFGNVFLVEERSIHRLYAVDKAEALKYYKMTADKGDSDLYVIFRNN